MEIMWFGYSCFRLKGKNTSVITDPFPASLGYKFENQPAGIITVSHNHSNHNNIGAVSGGRVISGPGEYEIGGVLVIGISTFHDEEKGSLRGKNNVYAIEVDDVNICHLGDLGHPLTAKQLEDLGTIDVLLVPVGGGTTISAAQAAALVRSIEPKIVIPMHYKTPALDKELDGVEKFLKEMGLTEAVPQPKLVVTRSNLPLTTQVMVLAC